MPTTDRIVREVVALEWTDRPADGPPVEQAARVLVEINVTKIAKNIAFKAARLNTSGRASTLHGCIVARIVRER